MFYFISSIITMNNILVLYMGRLPLILSSTGKIVFLSVRIHPHLNKSAKYQENAHNKILPDVSLLKKCSFFQTVIFGSNNTS